MGGLFERLGQLLLLGGRHLREIKVAQGRGRAGQVAVLQGFAKRLRLLVLRKPFARRLQGLRLLKNALVG